MHKFQHPCSHVCPSHQLKESIKPKELHGEGGFNIHSLRSSSNKTNQQGIIALAVSTITKFDISLKISHVIATFMIYAYMKKHNSTVAFSNVNIY